MAAAGTAAMLRRASPLSSAGTRELPQTRRADLQAPLGPTGKGFLVKVEREKKKREGRREREKETKRLQSEGLNVPNIKN